LVYEEVNPYIKFMSLKSINKYFLRTFFYVYINLRANLDSINAKQFKMNKLNDLNVMRLLF